MGPPTSAARRAPFAPMALIAAYAALVAFAGVFTMPVLDRDEARFAQATVQMLETRDYVAIRFQDDERNRKPAGIHWLQAASVAAFSSVEARDIWAYRIPSAVGAVLAALFTYFAGLRLFGPKTAFLAALLLASSPAIAGEATIAKTDAMLLACIAAAQTALIHLYGAIADATRPGRRWAALFWAATGAGILIKGPIILMVVGLTGAALFLKRPRTDWMAATRPLIGVAILAVMILPWANAIHEATEGRFFSEAIGGDMLAKIGAAQEHHGGPPGYYSVLVFILFWPAAALLLPGLRNAIANRSDWRYWFLIAWIAPSWAAFELAATKLPHYTLPLYPALAILAAQAAVGALPASRLERIGALVYGLVGLVVAALIAALAIIYQTDAIKTYAITSAAALAAATLAIAILYWRRRAVEALIGGALVSAGLAWTLLAGVLPNLEPLAVSPRANAAIDAAGLHPVRDKAGGAVLSGYYEPSAVFLLGTNTAMAKGRDAADKLAALRGAAIIESRENAAFMSRLAELGLSAEPFAAIDGVNYSNGDDVTLTLYRLPAPHP